MNDHKTDHRSDDLMTVYETARFLGIPQRAVYGLLMQGQLPHEMPERPEWLNDPIRWMSYCYLNVRVAKQGAIDLQTSLKEFFGAKQPKKSWFVWSK